MSEDSTVGRVSLSGSSILVFSVSQWRGRYWASVRKFVATQKYEGPTKSGLMFNKNLLCELVTTLARLEKTFPTQEESEFKTIPKNETEYIHTRIVPDEDSGGLPWVDIREFIDTPRYQGPTKRGIRFRWNLLPEVLACLRQQAKVIDENEKNEPSLFDPGSFVPKEKPEERSESNDTLSLSGLLGEDLKQFPEDFLDSSTGKGTRMKLPEAPLRLEQESTGSYQLRTEDGVFFKVRNPAEANFLIYAQLRGHREVSLPMEMIHIFRTVKAYENYLRSLRSRLFAKLLKKVCQETVASYETDKLFHSLGLPKLDT
jgi:hypothetical protein